MSLESDDIRLRDPKVAALAHLPGFGGYRDRDLEPIAAELEERRIQAEGVLVEEGSRGEEVFLVVEGKAAVLVDGEEVGIVVPGEFIGEMSIFDHGIRSATVRALTAMRLFAVPGPCFSRLLQDAAVARALARTLSERLRRAEQAVAAAHQAGFAAPSIEE